MYDYFLIGVSFCFFICIFLFPSVWPWVMEAWILDNCIFMSISGVSFALFKILIYVVLLIWGLVGK